MQKSNKNLKLVSVILPVRNNVSFLEDCLINITKQNYKNFEVIAIDDNSTDSSFSILQKYKAKDKRFKIFKNVKNYGLATTLNRCVNKSKGEFLLFADAKDIMTKSKIKKQIAFLLKNQTTVAVGTQCFFVDEENKKISKSSFPEKHLEISKNPLHGVSLFFEGIMINRNLIPKDLVYFNLNSNFLYSNIALKLTSYGELANINKLLFYHRKINKIKKRNSNILSFFPLWFLSHQNNLQLSLKSFFGAALRYTFLS